MKRPDRVSWWSVAWRAAEAADTPGLTEQWQTYFDELTDRAFYLAMFSSRAKILKPRSHAHFSPTQKLGFELCQKDMTKAEVRKKKMLRALTELVKLKYAREDGCVFKLTKPGRDWMARAGVLFKHRPMKPGPRGAKELELDDPEDD